MFDLEIKPYFCIRKNTLSLLTAHNVTFVVIVRGIIVLESNVWTLKVMV